MSLLHLPTEVLLIILNSLDQADVFALISTNRELYNVLNDHLYAHNIQHRGGDALIWAATHGNTALVQRFLRKGADPNIRVSSIGNLSFIPRGLYRPEYDFDGWMIAHNPACTHWTVFHPNPEGFYNRREAVHIEDTALEAALSNGNVEVAELLVGLDGVDVEKGIPSHLMPLNLAVRWEMEEVVRLLLEHRNVAVNAKDSENRTALHWAALDGHTRIVELILAREDVRIDVQDSSRWTALILAAMEGHTRIVELLLARRNINIHMAGLDGQTALHCAIRQGHDQIAELLLARDELDINLTDDQGCTALHLAAAHGHEAIVKLILDHPDVRGVQTNWRRETAFHMAAGNGHTSVVELLISRDLADYTALGPERNRPLFIAARNGHEGVVRVLLNQDHVHRHTIEIVYAANEEGEVPNLLLEGVNKGTLRITHPESWLGEAAGVGHVLAMRILLAHDGIDPDWKDENGKTPLAIAAERGYLPIMRLLLETGKVDINQGGQVREHGFILGI